MGARGPAKEPAALRLLKGPGNGRDTSGDLVDSGPKFNRGAPDAPEMLSAEGRAEWDRIVPGLERLDLLKPEDFAALVEHCETWATYVEAITAVRSEGIVIINPDNGRRYKNPALAAAETAAQQLRASCREFGLTPSSEQNLARPMVAGGTPEDDAFAVR